MRKINRNRKKSYSKGIGGILGVQNFEVLVSPVELSDANPEFLLEVAPTKKRSPIVFFPSKTQDQKSSFENCFKIHECLGSATLLSRYTYGL